MKIAFVDVTVTVSYGGIQTAVWELARALHDDGHQVDVFGGEGAIQPELGGRGIGVKMFPFLDRGKVLDLGSRFRRIVERWTFARRAKQAVIDGEYDWVVLTKPFDFFWPRLMPKGHPTRFAFMSGGTDFFRGDRILARGIDAWVACSHFNAWQIQHYYKNFPEVMFNGVDVARFSPQALVAEGDERETLRHAWGLTDADVLFAFAGRLVGWKGLSVAVEALASPLLVQLPTKLLIVGAGSDLPRLQEKATRLGVTQRVIFHEPVSHQRLPALYRAADVGIFPSIGDEAFGITVAEAMACGLPVVASYIGGIPEVVGNEGSCGFLVSPGKPAHLAQVMTQLAQDHPLRDRLGRAARERIVSHFTWRDAARRLLAALPGQD
ncbi:MAG TPA: glycosyltransferase family 4 protein [Rhodocyclaceae bacterium]|jgi:glycosyltransferase involved in cell wall biosynthesis